MRLALTPRLALGLHIGTLLLAGMGGLFLCVMAWRSRNFQIAVATTRMPHSEPKRSAIPASVVSGSSASTPRMKPA